MLDRQTLMPAEGRRLPPPRETAIHPACPSGRGPAMAKGRDQERSADLTLLRLRLDSEVGIVLAGRMPGGVAACLDALAPEALPRLRFEGPVAALRPRLRAALADRMAGPRWLCQWLLADVIDKVGLLAELTGAAALRVILGGAGLDGGEVSRRDGPVLRLAVSYRGEIRQATGRGQCIARGDVALVCGNRWDDRGAGLLLTAEGIAPARPARARAASKR